MSIVQVARAPGRPRSAAGGDRKPADDYAEAAEQRQGGLEVLQVGEGDSCQETFTAVRRHYSERDRDLPSRRNRYMERDSYRDGHRGMRESTAYYVASGGEPRFLQHEVCHFVPSALTEGGGGGLRPRTLRSELPKQRDSERKEVDIGVRLDILCIALWRVQKNSIREL